MWVGAFVFVPFGKKRGPSSDRTVCDNERMAADPQAIAVAGEVRQAAEETFGNRFAGLVLFGSRARGDHGRDSDVDLLLLLDAELKPVSSEDLEPLSGYLGQLLWERGVLVNLCPAAIGRYRTSRSPFFVEARRDAVMIA